MYRANLRPDRSSDTLVSARVSPGTEHAWWPAVMPAVPPAGVPGGFQPGDWKWVTLLGIDDPELQMRMIKVSCRYDDKPANPKALTPSVSSFSATADPLFQPAFAAADRRYLQRGCMEYVSPPGPVEQRSG